MINKIKYYIGVALTFTTGLGFYGVGLLIGAIASWIVLGWSHVAVGLLGAFVFKNFKAIVENVNSIEL